MRMVGVTMVAHVSHRESRSSIAGLFVTGTSHNLNKFILVQIQYQYKTLHEIEVTTSNTYRENKVHKYMEGNVANQDPVHPLGKLNSRQENWEEDGHNCKQKIISLPQFSQAK